MAPISMLQEVESLRDRVGVGGLKVVKIEFLGDSSY